MGTASVSVGCSSAGPKPGSGTPDRCGSFAASAVGAGATRGSPPLGVAPAEAALVPGAAGAGACGRAIGGVVEATRPTVAAGSRAAAATGDCGGTTSGAVLAPGPAVAARTAPVSPVVAGSSAWRINGCAGGCISPPSSARNEASSTGVSLSGEAGAPGGRVRVGRISMRGTGLQPACQHPKPHNLAGLIGSRPKPARQKTARPANPAGPSAADLWRQSSR